MVLATASFAQKTKTETILVSGNCGMCKSTIEKAAKTAGVKEASWDVDAKVLTVKYNSPSTNTALIISNEETVAVKKRINEWYFLS